MCVADGETFPHNVTRGVLQGGVVIPTLFNLIYLIGLDRCLSQSVEISMYADDICILCSGRNRCVLLARLQRAFSSITNFAEHGP